MPETHKPKTRKEFEGELIARAWKDAAFREELKSNPRAVVERELMKLGGGRLAEGVQVKVLEEDADHLYMVMPRNPQASGSVELSDEEVSAVAGGTALIVIVGAVVLACP